MWSPQPVVRPQRGSINYERMTVSEKARARSAAMKASQKAFSHVLNNVLALEKDDGLRLALQAANYKQIETLLATTVRKAYNLRYMAIDPGTGIPTEQGLLLSEHDIIMALRGFVVFKEEFQLRRRITPADWLFVTKYEFDTYHRSCYYQIFVAENDPVKPQFYLDGAIRRPAYKQEIFSRPATSYEGRKFCCL